MIIIEQDGFKITLHENRLEISTQVDGHWKSCTVSGENLGHLRRGLKAPGLPGRLRLLETKIKKALLNKDWYPTKAMFDLDFERCRTIVRLQHTLSDLYKILSEYNDQHKK